MTGQEILNRFSKDIITHLDNAVERYPTWPADNVHGAAIVGEEAGELIRAALQAHYDGKSNVPISVETMHTIVTALRLLDAIGLGCGQ